MTRDEKRSYHHGNLREALLAEAVRIIEAEGPAALSLRELSRRLGVSHAAPAHHFPDKAALLTAIAVDGYEKLAHELWASREDGFLETGIAYVRFVVNHPGHIKVMFEPSLYKADDPTVQAARSRTSSQLFGSAAGLASEDSRRVGLAGWSLMHGIATLWLTGNLREAGDDPEAAARWLAAVTFRSPKVPPGKGEPAD